MGVSCFLAGPNLPLTSIVGALAAYGLIVMICDGLDFAEAIRRDLRGR